MEDKGRAPARVEPLYCPLCKGDQPNIRRSEKDMVCGDCYRLYIGVSSNSLADEKGYITVFAWAAEQAPAMLTLLEEKLVSAKAEIKEFQDKVAKEAGAALNESIGSKEVPYEVRKEAFQQKKRKLWRTQGGDAKYAQMKGLESRITHLKQIIEKAENPEPQNTQEPATIEPGAEIEPGTKKNTQANKQSRRTKENPGEEGDRGTKTRKGTRGSRSAQRIAVAKEATAVAAQS